MDITTHYNYVNRVLYNTPLYIHVLRGNTSPLSHTPYCALMNEYNKIIFNKYHMYTRDRWMRMYVGDNTLMLPPVASYFESPPYAWWEVRCVVWKVWKRILFCMGNIGVLRWCVKWSVLLCVYCLSGCVLFVLLSARVLTALCMSVLAPKTHARSSRYGASWCMFLYEMQVSAVFLGR